MQTQPISKVKDRLNEYVDAVSSTHDQVTITKNGSPVAVLIGADEWESLQETLFWLSRPGILEDIAQARRELDGGDTYSEDHIRAEAWGAAAASAVNERIEPYGVVFASTAKRDLNEVPPRIASAIIEFVYGDLARNPRRVGKPLQRELEGLWGARRGPYRIIYDIIEDRVLVMVIRVDHRADIYRLR